MEPIRKKSIDNLVNELKSKYDVGNLEGLKQLAKDKEIYVIESDEIVISKAVLFEDGRRYILLAEKNSLGKYFDFGHELGHHLLDHPSNKISDKETEANYFSEQLLNKQPPYLNYFVNGLFGFIEKPLSSLKGVFIPSLDKKDALNIIKNYKQQNEKI